MEYYKPCKHSLFFIHSFFIHKFFNSFHKKVQHITRNEPIQSSTRTLFALVFCSWTLQLISSIEIHEIIQYQLNKEHSYFLLSNLADMPEIRTCEKSKCKTLKQGIIPGMICLHISFASRSFSGAISCGNRILELRPSLCWVTKCPHYAVNLCWYSLICHNYISFRIVLVAEVVKCFLVPLKKYCIFCEDNNRPYDIRTITYSSSRWWI